MKKNQAKTAKKQQNPVAKKDQKKVAYKENKKTEKKEIKKEAAKKVDKETVAKTTEFKLELPADKTIVLKDFEILRHPLITEKAIGMIEAENKLVFVVNSSATKSEIKKAVEELYKIKVDGVNILRDSKGRKRAFVKINKQFKADEIATKLGVL